MMLIGNPVNLAKDFHLYGLEWTPAYISWKLDDVEKFRVTTGIPRDTMYPILGVSTGSWGAGPVKSNTPFPTNVYVDYIRIYQKSDTILSYYSGLGNDPNVVENTDLLKAADDWSRNITPLGFTSPITSQQLLMLALNVH
jgi:beta-glucanase (GH16 family)